MHYFLKNPRNKHCFHIFQSFLNFFGDATNQKTTIHKPDNQNLAKLKLNLAKFTLNVNLNQI